MPQNGFRLNRPITSRTLTDDQLATLHDASMEILMRPGMRFYSQEALDLLKKGGARITDGNLVSIPAYMVERAMRTAPRNVTICDRSGRRVMALGGNRTYFGVGSDCMYIYDPYTGERRRAVMQDVCNGIKLVDALPNINFVMSMFMPADAPEETYERYQMLEMLNGTDKPIVFVGLDLASTVDNIEMASAVAGSMEALQRNPFVINYVNVTGPLTHNKEGVERLMYASGLEIPSIYLPGLDRGINAPMTAAGAIAMGNAGQLAGLVLSQLKKEGCPFIRGNPSGGELDMSTMLNLYASPTPVRLIGWELARSYGIPNFGIAGCSDAQVFDAQAAAEASLSIMLHSISGANLVHDIGYLDSAMTGSLELVAFCDEIIEWVIRYREDVEINDDTLALDVIDEVGPDGNFLEHDHTLAHVRKEWRPKLLNRLDYDRWVENGRSSIQERANKRVLQIIETHSREPLPDDVLERLRAIVRAADTEFAGRAH